MIAGKRQGQVISALMSNFDTAREARDAALNSDGSAEAELENWNRGIEASISRLRSQFQEFSTTAINSDFFKGLVDSGTALLGVLTSLTDGASGLFALFGSAGAISFIKNLD